ncbi:MAG: signal peptidase I [Candidatus Nanopelagicales bacterium]
MEELTDSPSQDEVAESEASKKPSIAYRILHWLRETLFVVVLAIALSVLLRTFFFQAFYVPSESMMQTLQLNDRILVSKLSYTFGDINRGDVIVFTDPGGWLDRPSKQGGIRGKITEIFTFVGLLPANSGSDLVKRVIGVPGDRIQCCSDSGRITVNGIEINEKEFVNGDTNQVVFDITVPDGRLFVMGDNRGSSSDSRFHLTEFSGTIPIDNVVGQVVMRVWPLDRFSTMIAPTIFAILGD